MAAEFGLWSTGLGAIALFMTILWLISLKLRDASIVDRVWGMCFVVLSATWFLQSPVTARSVLVMILVTIWGTRLSWHIHTRNRGHAEDYRYQAMRQFHGPKKFWWYSYFSVFLLQGGLASVISLPLFVAITVGPPSLGLVDFIGVGLWLIGFTFEVVGDAQLKAFKSKPENKGKLLTTGLWSLTRHPNYFGDATLWWGYYGLAIAAPWGFLSFVGPLIMTYFIINISGAKLLESDLIKKKPGYADYIRSTPRFFPRLRPKKANANNHSNSDLQS